MSTLEENIRWDSLCVTVGINFILLMSFSLLLNLRGARLRVLKVTNRKEEDNSLSKAGRQ